MPIPTPRQTLAALRQLLRGWGKRCPCAGRLTVAFCADADSEHRCCNRQYAHWGCRKGCICIADAFRELPPDRAVGLMVHELGHALADADPKAARAASPDAEIAADMLGERATGLRVRYDRRKVQTATANAGDRGKGEGDRGKGQGAGGAAAAAGNRKPTTPALWLPRVRAEFFQTIRAIELRLPRYRGTAVEVIKGLLAEARKTLLNKPASATFSATSAVMLALNQAIELVVAYHLSAPSFTTTDPFVLRLAERARIAERTVRGPRPEAAILGDMNRLLRHWKRSNPLLAPIGIVRNRLTKEEKKKERKTQLFKQAFVSASSFSIHLTDNFMEKRIDRHISILAHEVGHLLDFFDPSRSVGLGDDNELLADLAAEEALGIIQVYSVIDAFVFTDRKGKTTLYWHVVKAATGEPTAAAAANPVVTVGRLTPAELDVLTGAGHVRPAVANAGGRGKGQGARGKGQGARGAAAANPPAGGGQPVGARQAVPLPPAARSLKPDGPSPSEADGDEDDDPPPDDREGAIAGLEDVGTVGLAALHEYERGNPKVGSRHPFAGVPAARRPEIRVRKPSTGKVEGIPLTGIQSVIFIRKSWTLARARTWLRSHGFRVPAPDVTKTELRYRQVDPPAGMRFFRFKVVHARRLSGRAFRPVSAVHVVFSFALAAQQDRAPAPGQPPGILRDDPGSVITFRARAGRPRHGSLAAQQQNAPAASVPAEAVAAPTLPPLTPAQRKAVRAEIAKEPPGTVAVIGLTGVGKSSLINAMFGTRLRTSATAAATRRFTDVLLRVPPDPTGKNEGRYAGLIPADAPIRNMLRVMDAPGLGESIETDAEHMRAYQRNLPAADVILWVLAARDRSMAPVQRYLEDLREFLPRMIFVFNQADLVEPRDWNEKINLPSRQQQENIDAIMADRKRLIEAVVGRPVPVAVVSATRRYRLVGLLSDIVFRAPPGRAWVLDQLFRVQLGDFLPPKIRRKILRAFAAARQDRASGSGLRASGRRLPPRANFQDFEARILAEAVADQFDAQSVDDSAALAAAIQEAIEDDRRLTSWWAPDSAQEEQRERDASRRAQEEDVPFATAAREIEEEKGPLESVLQGLPIRADNSIVRTVQADLRARLAGARRPSLGATAFRLPEEEDEEESDEERARRLARLPGGPRPGLAAALRRKGDELSALPVTGPRVEGKFIGRVAGESPAVEDLRGLEVIAFESATRVLRLRSPAERSAAFQLLAVMGLTGKVPSLERAPEQAKLVIAHFADRMTFRGATADEVRALAKRVQALANANVPMRGKASGSGLQASGAASKPAAVAASAPAAPPAPAAAVTPAVAPLAAAANPARENGPGEVLALEAAQSRLIAAESKRAEARKRFDAARDAADVAETAAGDAFLQGLPQEETAALIKTSEALAAASVAADNLLTAAEKTVKLATSERKEAARAVQDADVAPAAADDPGAAIPEKEQEEEAADAIPEPTSDPEELAAVLVDVLKRETFGGRHASAKEWNEKKQWTEFSSLLVAQDLLPPGTQLTGENAGAWGDVKRFYNQRIDDEARQSGAAPGKPPAPPTPPAPPIVPPGREEGEPETEAEGAPAPEVRNQSFPVEQIAARVAGAVPRQADPAALRATVGAWERFRVLARGVEITEDMRQALRRQEADEAPPEDAPEGGGTWHSIWARARGLIEERARDLTKTMREQIKLPGHADAKWGNQREFRDDLEAALRSAFTTLKAPALVRAVGDFIESAVINDQGGPRRFRGMLFGHLPRVALLAVNADRAARNLDVLSRAQERALEELLIGAADAEKGVLRGLYGVIFERKGDLWESLTNAAMAGTRGDFKVLQKEFTVKGGKGGGGKKGGGGHGGGGGGGQERSPNFDIYSNLSSQAKTWRGDWEGRALSGKASGRPPSAPPTIGGPRGGGVGAALGARGVGGLEPEVLPPENRGWFGVRGHFLLVGPNGADKWLRDKFNRIEIERALFTKGMKEAEVPDAAQRIDDALEPFREAAVAFDAWVEAFKEDKPPSRAPLGTLKQLKAEREKLRSAEAAVREAPIEEEAARAARGNRSLAAVDADIKALEESLKARKERAGLRAEKLEEYGLIEAMNEVFFPQPLLDAALKADRLIDAFDTRLVGLMDRTPLEGTPLWLSIAGRRVPGAFGVQRFTAPNGLKFWRVIGLAKYQTPGRKVRVGAPPPGTFRRLARGLARGPLRGLAEFPERVIFREDWADKEAAESRARALVGAHKVPFLGIVRGAERANPVTSDQWSVAGKNQTPSANQPVPALAPGGFGLQAPGLRLVERPSDRLDTPGLRNLREAFLRALDAADRTRAAFTAAAGEDAVRMLAALQRLMESHDVPAEDVIALAQGLGGTALSAQGKVTKGAARRDIIDLLRRALLDPEAARAARAGPFLRAEPGAAAEGERAELPTDAEPLPVRLLPMRPPPPPQPDFFPAGFADLPPATKRMIEDLAAAYQGIRSPIGDTVDGAAAEAMKRLFTAMKSARGFENPHEFDERVRDFPVIAGLTNVRPATRTAALEWVRHFLAHVALQQGRLERAGLREAVRDFAAAPAALRANRMGWTGNALELTTGRPHRKNLHWVLEAPAGHRLIGIARLEATQYFGPKAGHPARPDWRHPGPGLRLKPDQRPWLAVPEAWLVAHVRRRPTRLGALARKLADRAATLKLPPRRLARSAWQAAFPGGRFPDDLDRFAALRHLEITGADGKLVTVASPRGAAVLILRRSRRTSPIYLSEPGLFVIGVGRDQTRVIEEWLSEPSEAKVG